jgi:hypothetical protein
MKTRWEISALIHGNKNDGDDLKVVVRDTVNRVRLVVDVPNNERDSSEEITAFVCKKAFIEKGDISWALPDSQMLR